MEALEVEVCCEHGAYSKAFVTDVFSDGVSVVFEKKWSKAESKFPFSEVYLPPPGLASSGKYTEDQEVEVFTKLNENNICEWCDTSCWWKAVIIKITGMDFHLAIIGRENTYMIILRSPTLRPRNNNPPIAFYKFEVEVPEELRKLANIDKFHEEFRNSIGAEVCRYSLDLGVLIIISRNEKSRQLSDLLQKMHFHKLGKQVSLLAEMKEKFLQLECVNLIDRTTKMIEKGEKLLQEKEKILSFAECPVCSDYMTAPISQCTIGHSICNECRNKLVECPVCKSSFSSTRNYTLEKIMENISFSCSNAEFGCETLTLLNDRVEHSKCCEYRLHECLPGREKGCKWQGRRQDILTHMNEMHKGLLWKGESNDMCVRDFISFYIDDGKWKCDLISAHGEIFWLQRYVNIEEETYHISVHYIGLKENCEKYVYTLTFTSSSDPQRKIIFSMRTHPDHIEIKDIKDTGCFSVKKCMAKCFMSGLRLRYNIKITKIE